VPSGPGDHGRAGSAHQPAGAHLAPVGRSDPLSSDDAVPVIHHASRGLPRAVNNLATRSLVAAFAVDKAIVDESAQSGVLEGRGFGGRCPALLSEGLCDLTGVRSLPSTPPSGAGEGDDPLVEVDEILMRREERLRQAADRTGIEEARRQQFLDDFATVCECEVRPAMEAVCDRLRRDGGGGFIEEHAGGEPRYPLPRLTLWMSLAGEIPGPGREDRNPYLRLDADATHGYVQVAAGDMWQGGGTHTAGRAGTWKLSEITSDLVEHTIVDILRRSAT
jgi:hypothetical protein